MPAHSRPTKNTLKNHFFNFLKVHDELGKGTKFGTSRPLFFGEIEIESRHQTPQAIRKHADFCWVKFLISISK